MIEFIKNPFLIGTISVLASIILTFLVRKAARLYGFVAAPKSDRWHKRPTAMMGGVAIYLTTAIVVLLLVAQNQPNVHFFDNFN